MGVCGVVADEGEGGESCGELAAGEIADVLRLVGLEVGVAGGDGTGLWGDSCGVDGGERRKESLARRTTEVTRSNVRGDVVC